MTRLMWMLYPLVRMWTGVRWARFGLFVVAQAGVVWVTPSLWADDGDVIVVDGNGEAPASGPSAKDKTGAERIPIGPDGVSMELVPLDVEAQCAWTFFRSTATNGPAARTLYLAPRAQVSVDKEGGSVVTLIPPRKAGEPYLVRFGIFFPFVREGYARQAKRSQTHLFSCELGKARAAFLKMMKSREGLESEKDVIVAPMPIQNVTVRIEGPKAQGISAVAHLAGADNHVLDYAGKDFFVTIPVQPGEAQYLMTLAKNQIDIQAKLTFHFSGRAKAAAGRVSVNTGHLEKELRAVLQAQGVDPTKPIPRAKLEANLRTAIDRVGIEFSGEFDGDERNAAFLNTLVQSILNQARSLGSIKLDRSGGASTSNDWGDGSSSDNESSFETGSRSGGASGSAVVSLEAFFGYLRTQSVIEGEVQLFKEQSRGYLTTVIRLASGDLYSHRVWASNLPPRWRRGDWEPRWHRVPVVRLTPGKEVKIFTTELQEFEMKHELGRKTHYLTDREIRAHFKGLRAFERLKNHDPYWVWSDGYRKRVDEQGREINLGFIHDQSPLHVRLAGVSPIGGPIPTGINLWGVINSRRYYYGITELVSRSRDVPLNRRKLDFSTIPLPRIPIKVRFTDELTQKEFNLEDLSKDKPGYWSARLDHEAGVIRFTPDAHLGRIEVQNTAKMPRIPSKTVRAYFQDYWSPRTQLAVREKSFRTIERSDLPRKKIEIGFVVRETPESGEPVSISCR